MVILSDLFDDVTSLVAGLKHFRHRRHDVVLFHVLDPAELDFPFRGPTLFKGLEELPDVLTDPPVIRRAYLRRVRQPSSSRCSRPAARSRSTTCCCGPTSRWTWR